MVKTNFNELLYIFTTRICLHTIMRIINIGCFLLLVFAGNLAIAQQFETPITLRGVSYGQVELVDIDNDRDFDVLLSGVETSSPIIFVYENQLKNGFELKFETYKAGIYKNYLFDGRSYGQMAIGEIKQDGGVKLMYSQSDNFNFGDLEKNDVVIRNFPNNPSISVLKSSPFIFPHENAFLFLEDLDHDGHPDNIMTSTDNTVIFNTFDNRNIAYDGYSRSIYDMDSDQNPDLLSIRSTTYENSPFIYQLKTRLGIYPLNESHDFYNKLVAGDINGDGQPDFLGICEKSQIVNKFLQDDKGNFSVEKISIDNPQFNDAIMADLNSDGLLDIITFSNTYNTESSIVIYLNSKDGFYKSDITFPQISAADVKSGDLNNDGYPDLVISGFFPSLEISKPLTLIYFGKENKNTSPSVPANLQCIIKGQMVSFNWDKSSDLQTASDGLTYGLSVWKDSIGTKINIFRDLKCRLGGNTFHNTSWYLDHLLAGNYFWSVRAIDQGLAYSDYAEIQSFTIEKSPPKVTSVTRSFERNTDFILEGEYFSNVKYVTIDSFYIPFKILSSKQLELKSLYSLTGPLIVENDEGGYYLSDSDYCVLLNTQGLDLKIHDISSPRPDCLTTSTHLAYSNDGTTSEFIWEIDTGGVIIEQSNENISIQWNSFGKHYIKLAEVQCDTGNYVNYSFEIRTPHPTKITGKNESKKYRSEVYSYKIINENSNHSNTNYTWEISPGGEIINIYNNQITVQWLEAGKQFVKVHSHVSECTSSKLTSKLDVDVVDNEFTPNDTISFNTTGVPACLVDIDKNGFQDVLLTNGTILLNSDKGSSINNSISGWNSFEHIYSTFRDFNHDGEFDLLRYDLLNHLTIYKNEGLSFTSAFSYFSPNRPYVIDFDQDGLEDVLIVKNNTTVELLRNQGNFQFEISTIYHDTRIPGVLSEKLNFPDFNNDGYKDIITFSGEVLINKNNTLLEYYSSIKIPDFMEFTPPTSTTWVQQQNNKYHFLTKNENDIIFKFAELAAVNLENFVISDLNADGYKDILASENISYSEKTTNIILSSTTKKEYFLDIEFPGYFETYFNSNNILKAYYYSNIDGYKSQLIKFDFNKATSELLLPPSPLTYSLLNVGIEFEWQNPNSNWINLLIANQDQTTFILDNRDKLKYLSSPEYSSIFISGKKSVINTLPDGNYHWATQSIGMDGRVSEWSEWQDLKVETKKIQRPTNLEIIENNHSEYSLLWTDNSKNEHLFSIEGFNLSERSYNVIGFAQADVTKFDLNEYSDELYTKFRVRAFSDTDTSFYSDEISRSKIILSNLPITIDFEDSTSIWLSNLRGFEKREHEFEDYGIYGICPRKTAVFITPYLNLSQLENPFFYIDALIPPTNGELGNISISYALDQTDCWNELTFNKSIISPNVTRIWTDLKKIQFNGGDTKVRLKIQNRSYLDFSFLLDNLNIVEGPESDFSDNYYFEKDVLKRSDLGITATQIFPTIIKLNWKSQKNTTNYKIKRAVANSILTPLAEVPANENFYFDELDSENQLITYEVTPCNNSLMVCASSSYVRTLVNFQPTLSFDPSFLELDQNDSLNISVLITDELPIDSLDLQVEIEDDFGSIKSYYYVIQDEFLIISIFSSDKPGRPKLNISVKDEINEVKISKPIVIGEFNIIPVIIGQKNIWINENNCFILGLTDLVVDDDDNIYPNDFTFSVLNGENYYVEDNKACFGENYSGDTYINVRLFDGQDSSAIFSIQVLVNDIPEIHLLEEDLSVAEDSIILIENLKKIIQISDQDDSNLEIKFENNSNYQISKNQDSIVMSPNYFGPIQIPLYVNDGKTNSSKAIINILVEAVNDAPIATWKLEPRKFEFNEDDSLLVSINYFNIIDPDNTEHFVQIIPGSHYTASTKNSAVIIPDNNYYGPIQVALTISDGINNSDTLQHDFYINYTADPLVITGFRENWSVYEDQIFYILTNDIKYSNPDNCCNEVFFHPFPGKNYRINNDNNRDYDYYFGITPIQNFYGQLNIPIQLTDETRYSKIDTLRLNVKPVNDSPSIRNYSASVINCINDTLIFKQNNFTIDDDDVEDSVFVVYPIGLNSEQVQINFEFSSNGDLLIPYSSKIWSINFVASDLKGIGNKFSLFLSNFTINNIKNPELVNSISHQELLIFPNPVKDLIQIIHNSKNINSVSLFDTNGRLIQTYKSKNNTCHFSLLLNNYEPGIYFINIGFSDETVIRKKIIID